MAAPVFRAIKATQKGTASTEVVVALPTGTENGDLLLAYVEIKNETDRTPTMPSGWTQIGEQKAAGSGATKFTAQIYRKEYAGEGGPTITYELATQAGCLLVAVEKGTWNTTTPIDATSGWTEETTTEPKVPNVTSTQANTLAFAYFRCTTAATGIPETWTERASAGTTGWLFSKELPGIESGGTQAGKKSGANISVQFSLTIAPVSGAVKKEHTITASQGQGSSVAKNIKVVKNVAQGQTSPAPTKAIARGLSVTQSQAAAKSAKLAKNLSITQTQSASQFHGALLLATITASQGQTVSIKRSLQRITATTQAQTSSIKRALTRTLPIVQASTPSITKLVRRSFLVLQTQSASQAGVIVSERAPLTAYASVHTPIEGIVVIATPAKMGIEVTLI